MVDIRELLKCNENVRHKYFESFTKLSWAEFTKNREATFQSMGNIFLHILTAIDYWLDFLQKPNVKPYRKFDEYQTFEAVKVYMEDVEKKMSIYLDSLSSGGLDKTYTASDDGGKTVEVAVEDVLVHVFEEEVHHRGELIALFWQMEIEPPLMSWKGL